MADGQQQQQAPNGQPSMTMPVIEDARAKIKTLNRIAVRMQRDIRNMQQRNCATQHERRELAAVEDSIRVMEWHRATVDDVCESERLLTEVVNAVRETLAARTQEERAASAAKLEEAMSHAGPFVDDLED